MARIRTIKPEFWTDAKIVALTLPARLFYIGMWNFADDYGCLSDEPLRLRLQVLPAEPVDSEALIAELVAAGCLERYIAEDGTPFLHVRAWEKHQKIDKRSVPRFGDPSTWRKPTDGGPPDTAQPRRVPRTPAEVTPAEVEKEGKGREETPSAPDPFDEFWATYPARDGKKVGKAKSRSLFDRLSKQQQQRAVKGAANLKASGRYPKDPERFLRRDTAGAFPFDDWQEPAAKQSPSAARPTPPVFERQEIKSTPMPDWLRKEREALKVVPLREEAS